MRLDHMGRMGVGRWAFSLLVLWGLSSADQCPGQEKAATVKINGVLETPAAVELKAETEQFKSLVIDRLVPHGREIAEGRNVVWFKTDAIDKQLKEAEVELRLAKLALQDAEFKHAQFLESQTLDRQAAQRSIERAREDYDHFVRIDRDQQLKSAEFSLKFAQDALENAEEELNQLEKMYRADELTEESEEIVLKRARRDVENAQFRVQSAQIQHQRTVNHVIPRSEVDQEDRLKRAEMTYESALRDLDNARQRRELELKKQRAKFDEQQEKFDELKSDRKKMVLKAPVAGIVMHGNLNRGALPERTAPLEAGKSVTADQVVATIVPRSRLQVRLSVAESDLRHVQVGQSVQVVVLAFPQQPLTGRVHSLSPVPYSGNKYDCVVRIRPGELADKLVPTMGCRVEFPSVDPVEKTEKDAEAKDAEAKSSDEKPQADEAKEAAAAEQTKDADKQDMEQADEAEDQKQEEEKTKEDKLTGVWDGTVSIQGQQVADFEMELTLREDDSVVGEMRGDDVSIPIADGRFDRERQTLKFRVEMPVGPLEPEFKLSDNRMVANLPIPDGATLTIEAVKR